MQVTTDPATDSAPSWSPDGTRIAFTSDRTGDDEIWILTLPAGMVNSPPPPPRLSLLSAGNPFQGEVTVRFELPDAQQVRVEVYDTTGRRIAVLAHTLLPAGENQLTWDGTGRYGRVAPAGVYVIRVDNGQVLASTRVTRVG